MKYQKDNMNLIKKCIGIFFLLLSVSNSLHAQLQIPEKPSLQTSVYEKVEILSSEEKVRLEQKLIKYYDSTSTQIVIAVIPSLEGEDISIFATEWAHKWGIGQAKEDNGVFILVATSDRKITIRTGYGVEHLLTDALSKRIISNIITPEFKQGNYFAGLDKGTDVIIQILQGEYKNNRKDEGKRGNFSMLPIIIIIIILLIAFSSKKDNGSGPFNNRGRKRNAADGLLEAIILSSLGRSGGGFGSSSGGGFGSGGFGGGFGGGGFGGGGASGGW